MLAGRESKAYTQEILLGDLTDKVGPGQCIQKIDAVELKCNSYGFSYLWNALSNNIVDTSFKELRLYAMTGGVTGGDVMLMLDSSAINSLIHLDLGFNPDWWNSGDAFP